MGRMIIEGSKEGAAPLEIIALGNQRSATQPC